MTTEPKYRFYWSDRSIPLLYVGPPLEKPIVTLENYIKWYSIFMVMTDGSVKTIDQEVIHELETETNSVLYIDHCVHPGLLEMIAHKFNAVTDPIAVETAIGRWETDNAHLSIHGMEGLRFGPDAERRDEILDVLVNDKYTDAQKETLGDFGFLIPTPAMHRCDWPVNGLKLNRINYASLKWVYERVRGVPYPETPKKRSYQRRNKK